MRTTRSYAILAMVVSTVMWGCDSGNSNPGDTPLADDGKDVPAVGDVADVSQPPADVPVETAQPTDNVSVDPSPEPGASDTVTSDTSATDPGTNDTGTSDTSVTDPGTNDPGASDTSATDPGTSDPGASDTSATDPGTSDPGAVDTPLTEVFVNCPLVTTGPTCREIATCVLPCGGADRETKCVGTTTGDELSKWEHLRDCLATAACAAVYEDEQFSECARTNCREQLEGCVASATGKCCTIVNCRKDCDPDDPACPMRCYGLAPVAEQSIFVTYKDCILAQDCAEDDVRSNGWPNYTCEEYAQNHNCPIPTEACFPPNCN